ncbi:tyrosine-type recombinase/integrase [Oceanobacillus neutriphilus]|uniref:Site-specific integrase n=1 Tax=Oceanobacillus neutriphilus TaxID=531815 RepID=A0ABQ2NMT5_9BACI|nr:tyrosine-type recombinase/integrase [Oceanobacillus neutriphilus]GGP07358.1 site-specific integrase [Oceanobacillus neutriphilus]
MTTKLNKSKKDKDLYWYTNKKGEKLWMYRHKYKDTMGKRKEKKKSSFTSEDAALKALLKVKSDLLNGNVKQVEKDNLTVSQWMDMWYETHKNEWKTSTQTQRERLIRLRIKPLLGNENLAALDKSTYKLKYINELTEIYSPSTVSTYHTIFKIAINAAVDDEILSRNRFNKITIPGLGEDSLKAVRNNYLNVFQLNRLLDLAKEYLNITNYSLMYFLAYTGLRKGEALGIQWRNIDFEANTITVERTRDCHSGIRPPKTKNSYRTIPVDVMVMAQLKKYKIWCKERLLSKGKHLKDDDFVFISTHGNPVASAMLNNNLKKLIEDWNLKSINVHGLRHTHATILVNLGLPSQVIAERLGNTPRMIDKIYGHVLSESEDKSVRLFSKSLELGAVSGAN